MTAITQTLNAISRVGGGDASARRPLLIRVAVVSAFAFAVWLVPNGYELER